MSGDTYTFDTTCSGTYQLPSDLNPTSTVYDYYTDDNTAGSGLIVNGYINFMSNDGKSWTGYSNYINTISSTASGKLIFTVTSGGSGSADLTQATQLISGQQRVNDNLLQTRIQAEYCFYKKRYNALLNGFLNQVKPSSQTVDSTKTSNLLAATIEINKRLNALVLLVKEIGDKRIASVNAYTNALNQTNREVDEAITSLSPTGSLLQQNNIIEHTRKEMVRFTKEKNNSVSNQISLWASLNVVAIAIIFHVYRNM